jgi:hypothetical protein
MKVCPGQTFFSLPGCTAITRARSVMTAVYAEACAKPQSLLTAWPAARADAITLLHIGRCEDINKTRAA